MFARITSMDIKLERIQEAVKIYEHSVVPAAKIQKGYLGAYLFSDPKTGKGISLTLWKSEQDAISNERNLYYQEQLVKFIDFFQSQPVREGFEVVVKA
jgi:heme-degrading monooxygenase HmoA